MVAHSNETGDVSATSAAEGTGSPAVSGGKAFHGSPAWLTEALPPGAVAQEAWGALLVMKDPESVHKKRDSLVRGGASALQLIADFDYTCTSFEVNGRRGSTCHGVLETCGLLSDDYHKTVQALKEKYYPLELDTTLTHEQRVAFMEEWVTQAHDALLQSGLTREKISQAVSAANIALRKGHDALFRALAARRIPLLVFSAGLADVLEEVLRQHALAPLPPSAHVISNRMAFENGSGGGGFIGFTGQLFHVFNKFAGAVMGEPYFVSDQMKQRRNVILLGDSLGDLKMVEGLETDTVLSIGYLNDRVPERLSTYMAAYDVVILGPSAGLQYALELVRELR